MSAQDVIAFDIGSRTIKCGAVSEAAPTVSMPAIVGHRATSSAKSKLLKKSVAAESDAPAVTTGDAAIAQLRLGTPMSVSYPVTHGVVTKWDDMEHIFNACFTELLRAPNELSVVFAVPAFNPREATERLVQTMFESFEVERVATVPQGLCALYASGRTTGVVLDVGHGLTSVTPVYDSFPIDRGMDRINSGGADVTEHFRRLLYERGLSFSTPVDMENLNDLKEATAMVADDYESALAAPESEYECEHRLPDGSTVTVGRERFRASEVLFTPSIVHSENKGLSVLVAECIKNCSIDTRRALSGSIVLTGGTTQMPGFAKRLQDEVERHFPGMFGCVNVLEPHDRVANVWAGAAVLANMPTFEPYFITRDVYDEHGPEVVHGYYNHAAAGNGAAEDDEDGDAPPPPPPDDD